MVPAVALEVADMFAVTEAAGIHSHGLALSLKHLEQTVKKNINPHPNVTTVRQAGAFAVLDGDAGPGPVALSRVIAIGTEKAAKAGVATVWITNVQHHAAGFYHVRKPVLDGMIAQLAANAPASVAPFGSAKRFFGTNPLTFGAPAGRHPAYILDMATSVVAGNKIEQFAKRNEPVPPGFGIDCHGNPSTDPAEILSSGSLLPFGGAKGSGIAGMVNIMSGILSGGAYMDDVISLCRDTAKPANFGCCLHLVHIDSIMDRADYDTRMEQWVEAILHCPPAPGFGRVAYPGFPEAERLEQSMTAGIAVPDSNLRQFAEAGALVGMNMAKELGIPIAKTTAEENVQ